MSNVVLGVFTHRDDAEEAISKLESKGYNPKDISIMMRDISEAEKISRQTGAGNVVGGTLEGAATGAVLGGLAGLAATFIIPGLGAFFIGGPLATALGLTGTAAATASGAATGAVAGGLIGALISTFGLSREDAAIYESRIKEGGILIAVPTRSEDDQEIRIILANLNADNVRVVESPERTSSREEDYYGAYTPAHLSEIRGHRKRGSRLKRTSRR